MATKENVKVSEKELKKAQPQIESEDDDMEEPETKDYSSQQAQEAGKQPQAYIKFKKEFIDAVEETVGNLGYNRQLGSPERHVQVSQVMDILHNIGTNIISSTDADNFIGAIAMAPYNVIAPVMDIIQKEQSKFVEIYTPEQVKEMLMKEKQNA